MQAEYFYHLFRGALVYAYRLYCLLPYKLTLLMGMLAPIGF